MKQILSVPWSLIFLDVYGFLAEKKLKMRDVGPLLRAALTGMKQSPSIVDIMVLLGRSETSNRIRIACKSQ